MSWLAKIRTWWRGRGEKPAPRSARAGVWGERLAERLLRRKGYRILGRRVRVGRRDELDLIAVQGDTFVVVEVKTRASERFGSPLAAVNRAKRMRLSRAAVRFLLHWRQRPPHLRFDVIEVVGREGDAAPVVRHIENVFPLQGGLRLP